MYRFTASLRNLVCLACMCRYYHSCMRPDVGPSLRTRAQGASDACREGLRVDGSSVGGMEQAGPVCSRAYAKDVMHARYRKCLLAACDKQAEPGMSPSSGV